MKKVLSLTLLTICFFSAHAQDRGIGLRAGAPMGITYKKYLPQNRAVEFGVGTLIPGWYSQYYENSFSDYKRYKGDHYLSHRINSTVYLQGRYLFQNDIQIEGMMGKLEWYWGIGGLLKFANIEYRSRNENEEIRTDTRTDIDLGPEGILGLEYTFEDVPITIFGEFSLMMEFADRPLAFRGFSGVGARYNF
jgi:hypothetical protein